MSNFFAIRLNELCSLKGTKSEVARDLEINRQQFAKYLSGRSLPRPKTVERIAEYFGVSIAAMHSETSIADANAVVSPSDTSSLMKFFVQSGVTDVTDDDLTTGFYRQYKKVHNSGQATVVSLVHIHKAEGVFHYKRKIMPHYINRLKLLTPTRVQEGIFFKQNGLLFMFDVDTDHKELTFHVFRKGDYTDDTLLVGMQLYSGSWNTRRPSAARILLKPLDPTESPFDVAREQGPIEDKETPNFVKRLLGDYLPTFPGVLLSE